MTDLHYIFTFATTMGRTRIIRVPHADDTINDQQVRTAANQLISCGAFSGPSGQISSTRRIVKSRTTVTPIVI